MFTVLIRARWLSPLRHILFLCTFSYRPGRHHFLLAYEIGERPEFGGPLNHLPRVRKLSSELQHDLPNAPESFPEMPERPSEAPDRSRSR